MRGRWYRDQSMLYIPLATSKSFTLPPVCSVDLGNTVRLQMLKMAGNHISVGVHELSTVSPVGANEKAFHIIKVICVAVESLVWAVKSESGEYHVCVLAINNIIVSINVLIGPVVFV